MVGLHSGVIARRMAVSCKARRFQIKLRNQWPRSDYRLLHRPALFPRRIKINHTGLSCFLRGGGQRRTTPLPKRAGVFLLILPARHQSMSEHISSVTDASFEQDVKSASTTQPRSEEHTSELQSLMRISS